MTTEKLKSVLEFYNHYLDEVKNCSPKECPDDPTNFAHLMWMCDEAEMTQIPVGEVDKAMRWLGFIQGVLCAKGVFTLDELRAHSRSS